MLERIQGLLGAQGVPSVQVAQAPAALHSLGEIQLPQAIRPPQPSDHVPQV